MSKNDFYGESSSINPGVKLTFMKGMKKLLFILFVLPSCNMGSREKGPSTRDTVATGDIQQTGMFVNFDSIYLHQGDKLNEYLIGSFASDFEGFKSKDIFFNSSYQDINIAGLGHSNIYSIRFSEALPEVVGKKAYLVYNSKVHEAAVLFLDTLTPMKIKKTDTAMLMGGSFQNKGVGYFAVFNVINDKKGRRFFEIFNSSDDHYCSDGIPVYNSSLDCMCYDPFMLNFNNTDINKDGLNDLTFSGYVLTFCKGLETGYGRNERKPLHKDRIDIVFLTHQYGDSLYWTLWDTGVCKKIVYR